MLDQYIEISNPLSGELKIINFKGSIVNQSVFNRAVSQDIVTLFNKNHKNIIQLKKIFYPSH